MLEFSEKEIEELDKEITLIQREEEPVYFYSVTGTKDSIWERFTEYLISSNQAVKKVSDKDGTKILLTGPGLRLSVLDEYRKQKDTLREEQEDRIRKRTIEKRDLILKKVQIPATIITPIVAIFGLVVALNSRNVNQRQAQRLEQLLDKVDSLDAQFAYRFQHWELQKGSWSLVGSHFDFLNFEEHEVVIYHERPDTVEMDFSDPRRSDFFISKASYFLTDSFITVNYRGIQQKYILRRPSDGHIEIIPTRHDTSYPLMKSGLYRWNESRGDIGAFLENMYYFERNTAEYNLKQQNKEGTKSDK